MRLKPIVDLVAQHAFKLNLIVRCCWWCTRVETNDTFDVLFPGFSFFVPDEPVARCDNIRTVFDRGKRFAKREPNSERVFRKRSVYTCVELLGVFGKIATRIVV